MDSATAAALNRINREFYDTVAPEFSASRRRLNPGIIEALKGFTGPVRVLDAGCGDGRVGLAWAAGEMAQPWHTGSSYVGMDASEALLAARAPWPEGLSGIRGDLEGPGWPAGEFDLVCCFAALHHVPGRASRIGVLRSIAASLAHSGSWILSVWQFLHLERFRRRIVDWQEAGIDPDRVEPGDLLLDWRRGPRALRYVHHYDLDELGEDCARAGLIPSRVWRSDGEDRQLGLYLAGSRPPD